jgi:hypothetical protein
VKMINVSRRGGVRSTSDDLMVYTLARDAISHGLEREHDARRLREMRDRLVDNSDFISLFDPMAGGDGYFYQITYPKRESIALVP